MTLRAWLAVALALLLALASAWWAGQQAGFAAGKAASAESASDQYRKLLEQSGEQIKASQQASTALFQRLDQRARVDWATTQELHDALAKTALSRADCRFPADVMQQLAAARERAATAIAGGLGSTLPAAGGAR